jgi:hypothetical protein
MFKGDSRAGPANEQSNRVREPSSRLSQRTRQGSLSDDALRRAGAVQIDLRDFHVFLPLEPVDDGLDGLAVFRSEVFALPIHGHDMRVFVLPGWVLADQIRDADLQSLGQLGKQVD